MNITFVTPKSVSKHLQTTPIATLTNYHQLVLRKAVMEQFNLSAGDRFICGYDTDDESMNCFYLAKSKLGSCIRANGGAFMIYNRTFFKLFNVKKSTPCAVSEFKYTDEEGTLHERLKFELIKS